MAQANAVRSSRLRGLGMILLLCLFSARVFAEDVIPWARIDFPPFDIISGTLAEKGIIDRIRHFLQDRLVGYRHRDAGAMNGERLIVSFSTSDLCYPSTIRSDAIEDVAYLSVGVGIMPSPVIITTEETYRTKLPKEATLSLSRLLATTDLVLGVYPFALGPVLDRIVSENAGRSNVFMRQGIGTEGMLRMLVENRVDFTIGYPAEVMYWNRQGLTIPGLKLVAIPITETAGQYTIGRVACSKNEWGRVVIRKVNAVLQGARMDRSYIDEIFIPWIPEDQRADYLRDYRRILSEDQWTNVDDPVGVRK